MTPAAEAALVARLRAAGCVFAEEEAALLIDAARTTDELEHMAARRVDGNPLEGIIGWADFAGLRIAVDPDVFVPRRRSEVLVNEAVRLLTDAAPAGSPSTPSRAIPLVVDLCCGTGAIGMGIAARVPAIELLAADVDPVEVACARRNIEPAGGTVLLGDLYEALPDAARGRVDILVVNAPYVPTESIALMPPEARLHEPVVALDGGFDGLDIQRRVAAAASEWLVPGGHLLIETSVRQAPVTGAILTDAGLTTRVVHDDELDGTVVIGRAGTGTVARER
ncbi:MULTISPECIES: putative protein N(5)-glutamine methyltransferase [unclassified Leifsonia]|uniref:putative protein N(5)-glutamine methyltransferase n=1 Tax=unclassified Leifsonia TaxID=2663824 RepID=UPI0006F1E5C0|nr:MULTISPECIES: putative protein N(5)-glutamine methyltransferase [unclassified Leifsonia]KQX05893.1 hypothetical protein ASC59_16265 [Leifsonia sp. Root1293]KRA09525.1 hypothetical protein ASD61_16260 [Leifsonia sp. Root60]